MELLREGALIGRQTVLTSPACCQGKVGATVKFNEDGVKKKIEKVTSHVLSNSEENFDHEICLVELSKKVNYSPKITPICLASENSEEIYDGESRVVVTNDNHIVFVCDSTNSMSCVEFKVEENCKNSEGLALTNKDGELAGIVTGACSDKPQFVKISPVFEWVKNMVKNNFWEIPGAFEPDVGDLFSSERITGEETTLPTVDSSKCISSIDGFGPDPADSLDTQVSLRRSLFDIVNDREDAAFSSLAGRLPPVDLRTDDFWRSMQTKVVGSSAEAGFIFDIFLIFFSYISPFFNLLFLSQTLSVQ